MHTERRSVRCQRRGDSADWRIARRERGQRESDLSGRTRIETRGTERVRERVREIRGPPVIGRSDQCRSVCALFRPAGSFVVTPSTSSGGRSHMRTVIRRPTFTFSDFVGGREKERERGGIPRAINSFNVAPSVLEVLETRAFSLRFSFKIMAEHRVVPTSGTHADLAASDRDRSPSFANDGA